MTVVVMMDIMTETETSSIRSKKSSEHIELR